MTDIPATEKCRGTVLASKDGRDIIRCVKCMYVHVHPMYTAEELEKYYKGEFSESTPSHLWFEKVQNVSQWKSCGTILDFGCWEGDQLKHFVAAGWQCTGLEMNEKAAALARLKGIDVLQMSMREFFATQAGQRWDVINVAYVLEHLPEPVPFLRQLQQHLNPGGVAIIEVPNEFNPLQKAYLLRHRIAPYWIHLPEHVNYFDKSSLEHLVKRLGWEILHAESCFPMEMFLLMGDDYLTHPEAGRALFQKVLQFESVLRNEDPAMVSKIYAALYKCGVGRGLTLYMRSR